jgi:hypothetical protein
LNAVQIIVYAGAIMVLFVITIMLLNAGKEEQHQREPGCDSARHSRSADRHAARRLDASFIPTRGRFPSAR